MQVRQVRDSVKLSRVCCRFWKIVGAEVRSLESDIAPIRSDKPPPYARLVRDRKIYYLT